MSKKSANNLANNSVKNSISSSLSNSTNNSTNNSNNNSTDNLTDNLTDNSNNESTNNIKENKMGVMPIKKLIVTMSLPMMISMLVQSLYNIVDSIFVSHISENALAAVTLAYPLQNLMIAFATGTGVGVNALLSKSLGEKNFKKSDKAANTAILLGLLNYAIFFIIGLFFSSTFISSQTNNSEIIKYGTEYTTICCLLSFGVFYQVTFERLLQSTGLTLYSMISQITGAIVNTIVDPILIFGLLGAPKLGVAGAAYATVFGQICASAVGLTLNIKYNKEINLSLKSVFAPDLKIIKKIYAVGIPSILMVSIGSVMTYSMNKILETFTSTATAVFGAYFKLQSFIFMPVFGLNNGIIPIIAYNLGAKNKKRITDSLKFSLKLAVCIMFIGMILFECIPQFLLSFFNASDYMISLGSVTLRIIALHFPLAAVSIVLSSSFQACSKSLYSLYISASRQLIILIPVAWLLSKTNNVNNIWWAFPIAEVVSMSISIVFFKRIYNNVIKPLSN